jgi:mRNA interferase YafQ
MTKEFRRTTRFKKDYKREKKTHGDLDDLLKPILQLLLEGKVLPEKLKDHPLSGDWKDHRDCHIKPDLVLIYSVDDKGVTVVRIGSHSELF